MLKKIMIASLAAGALALNAPVAMAEPTSVDCGFNTIAQETATGGQDTFTGAAYGYIVASAAGNSVSVYCEVRVDGTAVDATDPGTGTTAATTQGQVTYTASDTQDVDLCAVWTDGADSGEACGETTTTQIPPQEVIDLLDSIFQLISDTSAALDPIICGPLASLSPGVPGIVDINSEGDVSIVELGKIWDCPPYDL